MDCYSIGRANIGGGGSIVEEFGSDPAKTGSFPIRGEGNSESGPVGSLPNFTPRACKNCKGAVASG